MSSNRNYFLSDRDKTPIPVTNYSKKKFEPKVMFRIEISPKILSTSVLISGHSMSVTACTYITLCFNPVLVPFLEENYLIGGYVFWPDKASFNYNTRVTCSFLESHMVNYVPKELNTTEVSQRRPIEDFFGVLATHFYRNN